VVLAFVAAVAAEPLVVGWLDVHGADSVNDTKSVHSYIAAFIVSGIAIVLAQICVAAVADHFNNIRTKKP
jgi:hypothetical protein